MSVRSRWHRHVSVTPDGRRAIVTGFGGAIHGFDLSDLTLPDEHGDEKLCLLGEIQSARRIQEGGGVVKLTAEEWLRRWREYRRRYPDWLFFHRFHGIRHLLGSFPA